MKLYEYQQRPHDECVEIIKQYGLCYLAASVRTGKSITSLTVMETLGKKHVLFVTTIKAMSSVQKDYDAGNFSFRLTLINFESLHKIADKETIDGVIGDEMHKCGSFPKPAKRAKDLKEIVQGKDFLMLSGTPSPEAFSQLYHQFWVHNKSPWAQYANFYKWVSAGYVFKYQMMISGFQVNKYERANEEKILNDIKPYMVKLTQEDASFDCPVEEIVNHVPMGEGVYMLAKQLLKDKVANVYGKDIVADTPAKMQMKLRQIYSGTIKAEDGSTIRLDESKVKHIKDNFRGKKIAIYYCFIEEGVMLREAFPNYTEDPMEFASCSDKVFLSQEVSGREGVSLKTADALINYNIGFSSTSYQQIRGRLQDKSRTTPAKNYFLFSVGGIEEKVYKAVSKKKNYTTKHFLKDYQLSFG